jgi:hypothetical protein
MRATGTFPARKPTARGRLAGEVRRAAVACGFVVVLCVLAGVIAGWSQSTPSAAPRPLAAGAPDLSMGSMLVVSPTGTLCRERTIDNSTWLIRNKGWVDCDEALAKSANSGNDVRSPGSRLSIIREGFLGRQ